MVCVHDASCQLGQFDFEKLVQGLGQVNVLLDSGHPHGLLQHGVVVVEQFLDGNFDRNFAVVGDPANQKLSQRYLDAGEGVGVAHHDADDVSEGEDSGHALQEVGEQ